MAVANPSGLKQYNLGTPHRRHISKAAARGHKKAVVDEFFADPLLESYILKITRVVSCEFEAMCSIHVNSILRSKTNESLKNFNWGTYLTEIRSNAPVLYRILLGASKSKHKGMANQPRVIGMCIAILLNLRSGIPDLMKHRGYRLCGYNIDKNVRTRYMRVDHRNCSLHCFHFYALENRVNFTPLSDKPPDNSNVTDLLTVGKSLLPTPSDDAALKRNVRLCKHMDFFNLSFN